jgi:hypothetical protein
VRGWSQQAPSAQPAPARLEVSVSPGATRITRSPIAIRRRSKRPETCRQSSTAHTRPVSNSAASAPRRACRHPRLRHQSPAVRFSLSLEWVTADTSGRVLSPVSLSAAHERFGDIWMVRRSPRPRGLCQGSSRRAQHTGRSHPREECRGVRCRSGRLWQRGGELAPGAIGGVLGGPPGAERRRRHLLVAAAAERARERRVLAVGEAGKRPQHA